MPGNKETKKWAVTKFTAPTTIFSSIVGNLLQISLVSCWIGGFASPALALTAGYYGHAKAVAAYLGIVATGYLFPADFKGSTAVKDFYVNYMFAPFKATSCHMAWLPTKKEPAIMLYHPHGMFSWGFANGGAWNSFYYDTNVCGFVAESLLHAPLFRTWFVKVLGGLRSAEKGSLLGAMGKRESIGLIPGGFHEATICHQGTDRVFLKNRKGFVKYALQHGYSLTPVYTFGESETYSNVQGMTKFRYTINDWKLPAIVPFGKWWFPLLPKAVELHTVGGRPLKLPRIEKPTKEDVDVWHGKYVQHLKEHFDEHKGTFGVASGSSKRELEIW